MIEDVGITQIFTAEMAKLMFGERARPAKMRNEKNCQSDTRNGCVVGDDSDGGSELFNIASFHCLPIHFAMSNEKHSLQVAENDRNQYCIDDSATLPLSPQSVVTWKEQKQV
jgi:hypothetical protein